MALVGRESNGKLAKLGNMNLSRAVQFPEINVSLIPNTLPKSRLGSLKYLLILKKIAL